MRVATPDGSVIVVRPERSLQPEAPLALAAEPSLPEAHIRRLSARWDGEGWFVSFCLELPNLSRSMRIGLEVSADLEIHGAATPSP